MNNGKKPFHQVNLDKMRELANEVALQGRSGDLLKLFGNLFTKADIPEEIKPEIVSQLRQLAENFPYSCAETVNVECYLKQLAINIEKGE